MNTKFYFVEYSRFAHPALLVLDIYTKDGKERLTADWFWADGRPTHRISMLDTEPDGQPGTAFGATELLIAIGKEKALEFARGQATQTDAPATFAIVEATIAEASKLRLHAMRSMNLFPGLIRYQNSQDKTVAELLGKRITVGGV